jgi:hypothetical protein
LVYNLDQKEVENEEKRNSRFNLRNFIYEMLLQSRRKVDDEKQKSLKVSSKMSTKENLIKFVEDETNDLYSFDAEKTSNFNMKVNEVMIYFNIRLSAIHYLYSHEDYH